MEHLYLQMRVADHPLWTRAKRKPKAVRLNVSILADGERQPTTRHYAKVVLDELRTEYADNMPVELVDYDGQPVALNPA